jgi:hypothetical protein
VGLNPSWHLRFYQPTAISRFVFLLVPANCGGSLTGKRSATERDSLEVPLKEILLPRDGQPLFTTGRGLPMPLAQPSRDDRQAVLAGVERLLDEYLDARNEFERVLQVVLDANQHSAAVNTLHALMDAVNARKLSLDRYVAAAANSAGED